MVDVRKLPLDEGWVLIPRERTARPHDFRPAEAVRLPTRCPFCAGHESETPTQLAVYPPAATGGWQVRVVPNKYPAIGPLPRARRAHAKHSPSADRETKVLPAGDPRDPLSSHTAGQGLHEVVIESPRHVARFADLTPLQTRYTLRAYRDRVREHRTDARLAYSLVFRNSGITGGASLEHVHSQIIATPWIPSAVTTELRHARAWHERTERCLFCELMERELADGRRIVAQSRSFVAWCPYASRFAYETWIAPRQHRSDFESSSDRLLAEFARLLQDVVARIEGLPGPPGYNFWIHTAPFSLADSRFYHWHLEITPRLNFQAAFEWGGGDYINALPPEEAAAALRW